MKLLYCNACGDLVVLNHRPRSCRCGHTSGRYLDDLNAVYTGDAVPIGFANPSFLQALKSQPEMGWGLVFEAFVIPRVCPTFVRVEDTDSRLGTEATMDAPPKKAASSSRRAKR